MSRRRRRRPWNLLILMFLIGLLIGAYLGFIYGTIIGPVSGEVEISMVYGSEKRGWIQEITPLFIDWFEERHPNENIIVSFEAAGSSESMLQIVQGAINPVIWSPAASFWVPLANDLWIEYGISSEELIPEENVLPMVYSPIVIASWEDYISEHNITGFESLENLANEENSDLKFAHTNPQLSNSGFCAVIMELAAAIGKDPQAIEYDDLLDNDVRTWLKTLESKAVYYGSSTGFLASQAIELGPNGINAFVLYENLIIEKNVEGGPLSRWGQKLIAVYPDEGILLSDHVFCILNAPWVTEEQRSVALEFYEFIMQVEIQEKAVSHGFRSNNPAVSLDPEIFNQDNGVQANITKPIVNPPNNPDILWRVPDLWLISRPRS